MYPKVEEVDNGYVPVLKVKSAGRIDLGVYPTARAAAVAHDVARLICLHEKRPDTDMRLDNGLMHPVDGYLVDPAFTQLLESGTTFVEVCSLLRAGVLADTFLCARDRQTRSNTSGERSALNQRRQQQQAQPQKSLSLKSQRSGDAVAAATASAAQRTAGAAAEDLPGSKQQEAAAPTRAQLPSESEQRQRQQQQQSYKSSADTQEALHDVALPACGTAPSAAATPTATAMEPGDNGPGSPSPSKRKAMRWLEWPSKGGGQFVSCISERALKSSMTLPVKMKRDLFQVTLSPAPIEAYDLQQGSKQRWKWEVRDYQKDERRVTSIHNLGAFFKHYEAVPGDVMVVVASAPGAVKAAIWKADSEEAIEFNAFVERQAEKQSRQAVASGGRKRAGEAPVDKPHAAKASKTLGGGKVHIVRSGPPVFSPDTSRPLSKTGSGPPAQQAQQQPPQTQPSSSRQQPQEQQQQRQRPPPVAVHVPRASQPLPRQQTDGRREAESGIDPSHPSAEETQALSPTGQVAQSPFRHQPLPLAAVASNAVAIKQEQSGSPAPQQHHEQEQEQQGPAAAAGAEAAAGNDSGAAPDAGGGAGGSGAAAEVGGGTHSPARMSCADASQLLGPQAQAAAGALAASQQQAQLSQPAASGAGAVGPVGVAQLLQELPDPLVLANDEAGVYVAMSRLLNLVAGSGRVVPEAVSTYRRSFGRLEPHGKRWFAYDSLRQLVEAAEWADVADWLLCK